MKLVTIFTPVVAIAAVVFSRGQERVTKTEKVVREIVGKLTAAMLQGDSATVNALCGPLHEVNTQGLVRHKPEVMATVRARAVAPRANSVGPGVTIDEPNLRTYGDTVVLVGRTTTHYQFMDYQTSPDPTQSAFPINTEQERFMKVYSKRDERWQIVASTRTAIAKH